MKLDEPRGRFGARRSSSKVRAWFSNNALRMGARKLYAEGALLLSGGPRLIPISPESFLALGRPGKQLGSNKVITSFLFMSGYELSSDAIPC